MSIFYKFKRPLEENFTGKQTRVTFTEMFVPGINDPVEKFCYAEIPEDLFETFLQDFGTDGEVINEDELPKKAIDIISGRNRKFGIIRPR